MNIKHLEYVIKVMECGSITKAASILDVSQPSLTKAISSLEEEYGIQILTRKARGVEFTKEGVDFVLYARGVLAAVSSFPRKKGVVKEKARLFVAAQQLDFIYSTILDTYYDFSENNLFFNLVETDRCNVVRYVLEGFVDIGFAIRTTLDMKELLWEQEAHRLNITVVDRADCYIAVGPLSPLWSRESVRFEELSSYMNVALDMEEAAKQGFWLEQGQYKNLNNNRIIYVNTISACETFLMGTDAVSYCSYWTRECYHNPQIRIIPIEESDITQELLLIRRKGELLTEVEEKFVADIYQRLGLGVTEDSEWL